MKPRPLPIRILAPSHFGPAMKAKLEIPHEFTALERQADAEVARIASESDVVISPVFKPVWRAPGASRLGMVHSTGAGTDQIDRESLPAGCVVCNVFGHQRALAEDAVMYMLALQKGLFKLDASLRKGDWSPEPVFLKELGRRRLLVLGFGHIGKELARFGRFFDMDVTALTRNPAPAAGEGFGLRELGPLTDLGRHLPEADFVIVALPHTQETENLLGEAEFRLMKPTAFLINVGRARVVNEQALYSALSERRIGGAGLGVWYVYARPGEKCLPADLPFHKLDNVIMTPHKATEECVEYRMGEIAANIRRFARGEPLKHLLYTVQASDVQRR